MGNIAGAWCIGARHYHIGATERPNTVRSSWDEGTVGAAAVRFVGAAFTIRPCCFYL
jgi:hypothetical protein